MTDLPAPKPAHVGHGAHPFGDDVWLLARHDGKMLGVYGSRHDAIGRAATLQNWEWYDPIQVPAGAVPMEDVVYL